MTRRDVLCGVAALGTLLAGPRAAQAQAVVPRRQRRRPGPSPAFDATREGFTRHVDQVFRVFRTGLPAYGIGLVAVQDGAAAEAAGTVGSQYCFSAVFVGPASDPLQEGTYEVATPEWAMLPLFLKRGAVHGAFQYYEAPFNGLPPA